MKLYFVGRAKHGINTNVLITVVTLVGYL
jgi:hypothetical protein